VDIEIIFNFIKAGHVDNEPPGTVRVLTVSNKEVAVFNVDGNIYAIENNCPHAGSSLPNGTFTASSNMPLARIEI